MDVPAALNLCPLCPEGQMSSVPDAVLQAGVTCGSLEKEVLPFLNQTQCDDQAANIALASNVCACLDISFDIPTCPDGTPLKQPDLTIDLLYWETPALLEAVDSLTCKDLGDDIRELTSEQAEYDNYLVYCGCIADDGTGDIDLARGICENGDPLDPAFLDVPIDDSGTTCESLALDVSYFIVDEIPDDYQQLFSQFIYYGHKLCGCEKVEEDDDYCDICEDGSVIQPVTEDDYVNCAYFAGIAYAISATDQFCPYYQGWGEYCGCNNPVVNEEVCRLCGDDTLLPDVWSDSETTFFGSEDEPYPCIEYEVTDSLFEVANDGLLLTCDERRELVGGECCTAAPTTTTAPSFSPSTAPTTTTAPSFSPSTAPTTAPTTTTAPSFSPSFSPSTAPTASPTASPTAKPTDDNSSAFRASISKKSLLITMSAVISTFVFGV